MSMILIITFVRRGLGVSVTILVVEDEISLADVLTRKLRGEGYTVEVVGSAGSALICWPAHRFDLVIVDVLLSQWDGFSVCRAIRAAGCQIPILFLTSVGSAEQRICGLEAGGDGFLEKPVSLRELLLRVQGMLRRQGWLLEGRPFS